MMGWESPTEEEEPYGSNEAGKEDDVEESESAVEK